MTADNEALRRDGGQAKACVCLFLGLFYGVSIFLFLRNRCFVNPKLLREKDLINRPAKADQPAYTGLLNISKSTLWHWVKIGKLPQPIKLSERVTVWKSEDIEKFLAGVA